MFSNEALKGMIGYGRGRRSAGGRSGAASGNRGNQGQTTRTGSAPGTGNRQ